MLFTVTFAGLVGQLNWPEYLPPPLFVRVPIAWPVRETYAVRVVDELVLVASTKRTFLSGSYSHLLILTVSPGAGGGGGVTVKEADRVTPPPETEIVTTVWAETDVVKMLNPPVVDPAGTMTPLLTEATARLLLAS